MKTAFSVFLIVLFAGVLTGPALLRTILKQQAKAVMMQRLSREEAGKTFTSEALKEAQWLDAHEFRLGGHLYDVSSTRRQHNGDMLYYCLSDELETQAENKAAALADDTMGRSNSPQRRLVKAFIDWLQDCCLASPDMPQCTDYFILARRYYSPLFSFSPSRFIEVINPPPEA